MSEDPHPHRVNRSGDRSGPARSTVWFAPRWRQLIGARTGVSAPAAAGLVVVVSLAVLLAVLVVLRGRPHVVTVPRTPVPVLLPSPHRESAVVVAVAGRVRRPGVVRLPAGSRVIDAVAAAGGLLPGTDPGLLNLAAPLRDGELIAVAVVGLPSPAGSAAPGGVIDLNTAGVSELDRLPGVGPVLAQRIVDWRDAHGRFATVDQLREVGGIGERKLTELRGRLRV